MSSSDARPRRIAKQSATTELDIAVFSGGAGLSWPRAKSTPSAVVTPVAMPAGEARRPGIEKQGVKTEFDIAVSSGEAGRSWPRVNGRNSTGISASCRNACR